MNRIKLNSAHRQHSIMLLYVYIQVRGNEKWQQQQTINRLYNFDGEELNW
jgi:hypothetical protein